MVAVEAQATVRVEDAPNDPIVPDPFSAPQTVAVGHVREDVHDHVLVQWGCQPPRVFSKEIHLVESELYYVRDKKEYGVEISHSRTEGMTSRS